MTTGSFVMWETRHLLQTWVCSKTQTLLATMRTQNQPQEVSCVISEVTPFPVSWMCKKHTSIPHSSTGALIFGTKKNKAQPKHTSTRKVEQFLIHQDPTCHKQTEGLSNEFGGSRIHQHKFFSRNLSCTSLKTNEVVIKILIKERSPRLRHVSRTHRVVLDWLFDRTNL